MMSVVCGKLHSVKSSKTATFNIDGHACPFAGSGASHVKRSAQRQHNNNDNEHDDDRTGGMMMFLVSRVVSVEQGTAE